MHNGNCAFDVREIAGELVFGIKHVSTLFKMPRPREVDIKSPPRKRARTNASGNSGNREAKLDDWFYRVESDFHLRGIPPLVDGIHEQTTVSLSPPEAPFRRMFPRHTSAGIPPLKPPIVLRGRYKKESKERGENYHVGKECRRQVVKSYESAGDAQGRVASKSSPWQSSRDQLAKGSS